MILRSHLSGARRRGVSLVLVVVSLVALVVGLAVSLQGGLPLTERRNAQSPADAPALAFAADCCGNGDTNFGN